MDAGIVAKILVYAGTVLTLWPALMIFALGAKQTDLEPPPGTSAGVSTVLRIVQGVYQGKVLKHGRTYLALFAVGLFLFVAGVVLDFGCDLHWFGLCEDVDGCRCASATSARAWAPVSDERDDG